MKLDTTLYYTLSTVAQALAAILGIVLAVFLSNADRLRDVFHTNPAGSARSVGAANVVPRLRQALGLSLIDVGLCFAALPFTSWLAKWDILAGGLLFVVGALSIACLVLYWRLITSVMDLVRRD